MLLPWLCDAASEDMDVLFGPGVSAWTLVELGPGSSSVRRKAEIGERCLARGRARYWVGENVTDLLCGRP